MEAPSLTKQLLTRNQTCNASEVQCIMSKWFEHASSLHGLSDKHDKYSIHRRHNAHTHLHAHTGVKTQYSPVLNMKQADLYALVCHSISWVCAAPHRQSVSSLEKVLAFTDFWSHMHTQTHCRSRSLAIDHLNGTMTELKMLVGTKTDRQTAGKTASIHMVLSLLDNGCSSEMDGGF